MRFATGAALWLGLMAGICIGVAADQSAMRRAAVLSVTGSQVTSKDTRTAVQIRRDMEK